MPLEIAEPVPSETRKLALGLLRRPSSDGLPRNDRGRCHCGEPKPRAQRRGKRGNLGGGVGLLLRLRDFVVA